MKANLTTTAKPKVGGAVYRAPIGTTLPTNAIDALDEAFQELGYCGDDGLVNGISQESSDIIAWGGDTVDSVTKSKTVTEKLKLIEALNVNTLKAVYGDENVTGTLETGIHVRVNSKDVEESSWVIDMIMRAGVVKRIVVPDVKLSELGEITYKDDESVGYEVTLKALPDESGDVQHEYIQKIDSDESDS